MIVVIWASDQWARQISECIADAPKTGQAITIRQAQNPSEVLAAISTQECDLLLVQASPSYLKKEILGSCDLFSVPILAITDTDADIRYATDLGLAQRVTLHACWSEILDEAGVSQSPTGIDVIQMQGSNEEPAGFELGIAKQETFTLERVGNMPTAASDVDSSKVISVWGPTGAPGRTSVAIALAMQAGARGVNTLLIDADTYGGLISLQTGLGFDTSGIAAACRLAHKDELTHDALLRFTEIVPEPGGDVHVLTGISEASRWPEISASKITTLLCLARNWFDLVIVDVGFNLETDEEITSDMFAPRRNAATLTALRDSDSIVAVSGAGSVAVARYMRSVRELHERFSDKDIYCLVNNVPSKAAGQQVREVLERFGGISPVALLPSLPLKPTGTILSAIAGSKEFQQGISKLLGLMTPSVLSQEKRGSGRRNLRPTNFQSAN